MKPFAPQIDRDHRHRRAVTAQACHELTVRQHLRIAEMIDTLALFAGEGQRDDRASYVIGGNQIPAVRAVGKRAEPAASLDESHDEIRRAYTAGFQYPRRAEDRNVEAALARVVEQ